MTVNELEKFDPKCCHMFSVECDYIKDQLVSDIELPSRSRRVDQFNGWEWNSIVMEMFDPMSSSSTQIINNIIKEQHGILGTLRIRLLNLSGDVDSEWILEDTRILSVSFGSLSWARPDVVKIRLTLRYSDAQFFEYRKKFHD